MIQASSTVILTLLGVGSIILTYASYESYDDIFVSASIRAVLTIIQILIFSYLLNFALGIGQMIKVLTFSIWYWNRDKKSIPLSTVCYSIGVTLRLTSED